MRSVDALPLPFEHVPYYTLSKSFITPDAIYVGMELPALTQFIANVSIALDGGYDIPLDEVRLHIERGDIVRRLTDLCCDDTVLMTQLFRAHWTAATERELIALLHQASSDGYLAGSFHRSGLCYLIALTAGVIERTDVRT